MKPTFIRLNRRQFFRRTALAGATAALLPGALGLAQSGGARRMKIAFTPGSIGVRASQTEAIRLAHKHGFEAVEPNAGYLASLDDSALKALLDDLKGKNLVWAAAGFPLQFRGDEQAFEASLKELPKFAATLKKAGAERVGTWLTPGHNTLSREENLEQHAKRLREGARILKEHGLRLGLEYVGTITSRQKSKFPFVFNLAGARELIARIGQDNVGLVLDSWHWWQAGDTVADLHSLKNAQVVSVDLNDAPAGLAKDQQLDNQRELPASTGVIDVASFLNALNQIGYDGPVRAEPFNKKLNDLDDEAASAATAQAMKKAFAFIK